MSMIKYDDSYSYEIFEDGYDIYIDSKKVLVQRGENSKPFDAEKSYEENAIMHIETIIRDKKISEKEIASVEKNRANIEYMALMLDVELPIDSIPEEGE